MNLKINKVFLIKEINKKKDFSKIIVSKIITQNKNHFSIMISIK